MRSAKTAGVTIVKQDAKDHKLAFNVQVMERALARKTYAQSWRGRLAMTKRLEIVDPVDKVRCGILWGFGDNVDINPGEIGFRSDGG